MSRARRPWERQIRETPKAWEAFNVYRELGPGRSIRQAAEKLGKSDTVLDRWSARWSWVARCAEWDNHLAAVARAAEVREREKMAKRHTQIGIGLQNEVILSLKSRQKLWDLHLADPHNVSAPPPLDANDVRLWASTGVTIERLARGEATERHEHGPTRDAAETGRTTEREILERILADPAIALAADTLAAAVEGVARSDGAAADEAEPDTVAPPPAS